MRGFSHLFILLLTLACLAPAQEDSATTDSGFSIERPSDAVSDDTRDSAISPSDTAREVLVLRSGKEQKGRNSFWLPFASLAMPGLAEYQLGRKKFGKTLMAADGFLWIGLASCFVFRSNKLDELRAYLYTYGAANGQHTESGRNAWDLSESEMEFALYADSSAFYEERVFKPSRDPLMQKIDFYWQWDSDQAHQTYYGMWKQRNSAKVYGYYFLGGAVVLRAASFIHARYVLNNQKIDDGTTKSGISLQAVPGFIAPGTPGLSLLARF